MSKLCALKMTFRELQRMEHKVKTWLFNKNKNVCRYENLLLI